MLDNNLSYVDVDAMKRIPLRACTDDQIATIKSGDGFFTNKVFSEDFRVRMAVYEKLLRARHNLPPETYFMIYEAYRPLQRQITMWNKVLEDERPKHPHASQRDLERICENFVANPFDGIGSGHLACCAIDVTLCDTNGKEFDMGTPMHGFTAATPTASENISAIAKRNRGILKSALEKEGLVNFPGEWWHYSYGDHQWAWLTGQKEAIFGPIDLPPAIHD